MATYLQSFLQWVGKYWFQLFLVVIGLHLFFNKDISLDVRVRNAESLPAAVSTSLKDYGDRRGEEKVAFGWFGKERKLDEKTASLLSDEYSYIYPLLSEFSSQTSTEEKEHALRYARHFVERFAKVAITEMNKYDIPASIILARGILASNSGEHILASQYNNYFRIECRQPCRDCRCAEVETSDNTYFQKMYDTAWESFRNHSHLLSQEKWSDLRIPDHIEDYKAWAKALEYRGMAHTPNYAATMVDLIEELDLHLFDKTYQQKG
jgi:flagellum-specific peptidoglycan hydrolase FlgJ